MLLSFKFGNDHLLSQLVSGFDIRFLYPLYPWGKLKNEIYLLAVITTCTASFLIIISVSMYAVSRCLTLYVAAYYKVGTDDKDQPTYLLSTFLGCSHV